MLNKNKSKVIPKKNSKNFKKFQSSKQTYIYSKYIYYDWSLVLKRINQCLKHLTKFDKKFFNFTYI